MINDYSDVIVAQCTPQGPGALALIRLTGTGVLALVSQCAELSSKKKLLDVESHTISHGFIIDKRGEKIDEVLFLVMHAPKTFTGQDTVEISCHNNQLIVQEIIETALFFGAKLASPGEFSKRAVLEQKMDIPQAEAIQEIITATNTVQLKKALQQKEGSLSFFIQEVEQLLQEILAFCQASFEFIEEENIEFSSQISKKIAFAQEKIEHILIYHNQQNRIREGIKIAIIGSVNAGKSSLFNALLKKNRAIVSDIAGTTRDTIEAQLHKDGVSMTFIDTAGIRITEDTIEQLGIVRTYDVADIADIVVIVIAHNKLTNQNEIKVYQDLYNRYKEKSFTVISKSDLDSNWQENKHTAFIFEKYPLFVTINKEETIQYIEKELEKRSKQLLKTSSPFLLSVRQFQLLASIKQNIAEMHQNMLHAKAYELVAADTIAALEILGEITGKTIQEDSMDAIFRQFCVGK